jgi:hypothetical protein
MKNIRAMRQFLERRRSRLIDLVLGLFVGILCLPLLSWSLSRFAELPSELKEKLLLLLCLTQLITLAWLVLLYEKYDQCKRYVQNHHPNVDLDSEDEFSDGFADAVAEEEKKNKV